MRLADYSFIVVGSGFFGAVLAERIASVLKQPVLVLEKRNHIGGNCYSAVDDATGIEYHPYGTHIFHTSNETVWRYINRFAGFNAYRHQVLSCYRGRIFQLPINLETINSFFGVNLKPYETEQFLSTKRVDIASPANFEERALSVIGPELYEAFIKGYTIKQWQVDPRTLPPHIFDRIPVRNNYDENYFFDQWQGVPEHGYAGLFNNLLRNDRIEVRLNTDFFAVRNQLNANATLVYSGPMDKFFDYRYGALSWRTVEFQKEILPVGDFQGNAVVNYPELEIPYTRIHEPRHLHPEREYERRKTLILKEYSLLSDGSEPFYPIATVENNRIYQRYREAANVLQGVYIGGRLGDYQYLDMHQTIARALELFETQIEPRYRLNFYQHQMSNKA